MSPFQPFIHKWRIAIESTLIVLLLVGLKLIVQRFGWEFIGQNALFASIIAGGIFLFGLILSGVMADYKEAEKIPAEIVSSCYSIYEEGLAVREGHPTFDLTPLAQALLAILAGFRADITSSAGSRLALSALSGLAPSFRAMEQLAVPVNYIVRLKQEVATIRRHLLRVYYIQRISFLPSAYILVQSIVVLIIALLIFTRIEPYFDALIILVFMTYLIVYILKLLKKLDTPFREKEKTMDDVSLFLMHELENQLSQAGNPGQTTPPSA